MNRCRNLAYYAFFSLPLTGILMQFVTEGLVISTFERLIISVTFCIAATAVLAGIVKVWKAAYEKSQPLRSATSLLLEHWWAIFVLAGGILIAIDFLKQHSQIGYLGALLWLIALVNITWRVVCTVFDKMMLFLKPKRINTFVYPKPQFTAWMGPACPMCDAPFGKTCIDGQGRPRARHNARK